MTNTETPQAKTYRERREAKAERLRVWAEKREQKAQQAFETTSQMQGAIPFGQPILVGHYSEGRDRRYRDRIDSTMRRGVEHSRKAEEFERRANGIEAAAERAIYSDDHDAIERLEERIAELEAERDRIKAYNASCRKGQRNLDLLNEAERQDLLTLARVAAFQLGKKGEFPSYKLSNLSGNIKRNRDRLAELVARASH